jgi:hypothetical protein
MIGEGISFCSWDIQKYSETIFSMQNIMDAWYFFFNRIQCNVIDENFC